jgi:hypothetical protein
VRAGREVAAGNGQEKPKRVVYIHPIDTAAVDQ